SIAVLIGVVCYLFWVRGTEVASRLAVAKRRFHNWARGIFAGALVSATALGGFIFYNTNILNAYVPQKEAFKRQAARERTYKKFEKVNQPKVIAVNMAVDILPKELRAAA